jgi:hypothetical protein
MQRRLNQFLPTPGTRTLRIFFISLAVLIVVIILVAVIALVLQLRDSQSKFILQWMGGDSLTREKLMTVQRNACPGAPFVLPADGFIGLLYEDHRGPYSRKRPHQGIDIFSADRDTPGLVPVYAAYDGYVTREADWRSSLIQRIPEDPLNPGQQIWLYYTHMADRAGADFIIKEIPPDTQELFVEQGTLLGYTGNYNGSSARGIWVHLHFSIIKDDGAGKYTNELDFKNSLDPSPYLGMNVNYGCAEGLPMCTEISGC